MNSKDNKKTKSSVAQNSKRPEKQKSKSRPKKDPNAPKKPMTAFMFFSNDKRAELRAKDSAMKMTEVAKECGRLWRETSDSAKGKYVLLAEEDKRRYENQMKDYQQNGH